jgi:hypothetical protein
MHPENWPSTITENEYFCISDLSPEIATPIDQAHILDLFKYVGYPFKFKGLYAGSMVLASDNKGPLPIKLKYIQRVTKISHEEVKKFFDCMNSAGDDLADKMKDILSKFANPQENNGEDVNDITE